MRAKERKNKTKIGSTACVLIWLLSVVSTSFAQSAGDPKSEAPTLRSVTAISNRFQELSQLWIREDGHWPPRDLYLRHFKKEKSLELWARHKSSRRSTLIHSFSVCASSGDLGPKKLQGDRQVPEGFYWVDHINHDSDFHLSLGIDYPNAVDMVRANGAPPGGEIYIHGDCVTIGCVPLQDGPVELVFTAAVLAREAGQRDIPVHLFPCKMDDPTCIAALTAHPDRNKNRRLWDILARAFTRFERTHVVPNICLNDEPFYAFCSEQQKSPRGAP